MNRRTLVRAGGSIALIVLSTSTATDCERMQEERSREGRSRSSSQVEIRADDDTCWKVTVDDRTHSGCGDATFYGHRSSRTGQQARVEKVDGRSTVRVSLVVDGRTVARETVRSSGQHVQVRSEVRSENRSKDRGKDRGKDRSG